MKKRYNPLSPHLKSRFGCRVFKVSIHAGLTCPNRDGSKGRRGCTYCDPATLLPEYHEPGLSLAGQLEKGMAKARARHKAGKFIAYFQINTSTHAPVDFLERIYHDAAAHPDVVGVVVSTRPDCLGEAVLDVLSSLGEKLLWVELGLQSSNDVTLERINRGHTARDFEDAVRRARRRDIDVCAHMIIGLPGEGRAEVLATAEFLSRLKVWGVKFHQMQVIRSTALEEAHKSGGFDPPGLEEYSRLVVECLQRLPEDTVIHRLCGDVPERFLTLPRWGKNKFAVTERIIGIMEETGAYQGELCTGLSARGEEDHADEGRDKGRG